MPVASLLEYSYASCWHLLYLKSELSCEYIQSIHLACSFGQMLTKAISWMKSSIASPTSSGVPVSPLRSWSWSLFYNRFRLPPKKFIGSHSDTRWTVLYWSHFTHFTVTYSTTFYYELVVCHPALCHVRLYVLYWRACNKIVEQPPAQPCITFSVLEFCIKDLSASR